MILTSSMKYVTVVAPEGDAEGVSKALLRTGAIDFISVKETLGAIDGELTTYLPEGFHDKSQDYRRRVDAFLAVADIAPPPAERSDASEARGFDEEKTEAFLNDLSTALDSIRSQQKIAAQRAERWAEFARICTTPAGFDGIEAFSQAVSAAPRYLCLRAGKIRRAALVDLQMELNPYPVSISSEPDGVDCFIRLAALNRDAVTVDAALERYRFVVTPTEDAVFPENVATLNDVVRRAAEAEAKRAKLAQEAKDLILVKRDELETLRFELRMSELGARVKSTFARTARTVVFSGWAPERLVKRTVVAIKKECQDRCVVEAASPGAARDGMGRRMEPPTELRNWKFIAPFQWLVRAYATPAYGGVNPTGIVAVLFFVMFGLMFADAGHGLVVAIIGLVWASKLGKNKEGMRSLGKMMCWGGVASIISGILFGSYFGFRWFKPVWFDYHGIVMEGADQFGIVSVIKNGITSILGLTVYFGLAVISLGLLFNWFQRIKRRDFFHLIFSPSGLVGGWAMAGGFYVCRAYVMSGYSRMPSMGITEVALGIPTLILLFEAPVAFIIKKRRDESLKFSPGMIGKFLFEWVLAILETYTGYLSNILSFMRVAALGIAHIALMNTFYGMSEGLPLPANILVKILGNVVVIALEGFSAGVNGVRLNYYEFFNRFFIPGDKAYKPLSLRTLD